MITRQCPSPGCDRMVQSNSDSETHAGIEHAFQCPCGCEFSVPFEEGDAVIENDPANVTMPD